MCLVSNRSARIRKTNQVTVPAIEVQKLTVTYDAQPVLWDIDLVIPQQVVMGLVGPNGAGKSTLLKSILDLTPKLAGTIKVLGQPFAANRKSNRLRSPAEQHRLGLSHHGFGPSDDGNLRATGMVSPSGKT